MEAWRLNYHAEKNNIVAAVFFFAITADLAKR